jgi:hypothetical protein
VGGDVELEAVDHMRLYAWILYCCVSRWLSPDGRVGAVKKRYSLGAEAEWSLVYVLLYQGARKESEDQKRKICRGD